MIFKYLFIDNNLLLINLIYNYNNFKIIILKFKNNIKFKLTTH